MSVKKGAPLSSLMCSFASHHCTSEQTEALLWMDEMLTEQQRKRWEAALRVPVPLKHPGDGKNDGGTSL